MRWPLRSKFTLLQLALLTAMTVVTSLVTDHEMQKYYRERLQIQAAGQLQEIRFLLADTDLGFQNDQFNVAYLPRFSRCAGYRLTLIDSSGAVRFDSNVSVDSLPLLVNHRFRREIMQAEKEGLGFDTRSSPTLHEPMFYAALRVKPDYARPGALQTIRYIRIALSAAEIDRSLAHMRWKVFGSGALVLLMMATLSLWAGHRLTHPLQKLVHTAERVRAGDWDAHFDLHSQDELGKLADLLNGMMATLRNDLIRLRKLEQVRTRFLGNVSHELRTPIFAVQGYLETLLNTEITDATVQKEFVSRAFHQAERLNHLLTDLIDISRIESGEMKLSFQPFLLHDWLDRTVEELQAKAAELHIPLYLNTPRPAQAISVTGDQERLTQVMVNLIVNAVKYNVSGGVVRVGYAVLDKEVEIYVTDTGRGIAPEHLDRIFERFYRVDKERSRSVGGTGLGLAIVKHIVEAHGSRVQVRSEEGKGSRFSFRLQCG